MSQFTQKALKKLDCLSADAVRELVSAALLDVKRLENVIDSVALGILVCGPKNNLLLTNRFAKLIMPVEDDDSGKKPVWALVRNETIRQFLRETLEAGISAKEREIDTEANGVSRLLEFEVQPLVDEGRITGNVILAADISEKRVKETKMRRAENLASLTTLAAGVAHEIKNPLAAISIHMRLIKKESDTLRASFDAPPPGFSKMDAHISVVNDEIKRLNKMVIDFLFAVRPMDLNLRRTNINDIVREVVKLERIEAEAEKISCEARFDETVPLLKLDKPLIQQALVNLVKNAIEAIRSGPRSGAPCIRLDVSVSGERVILSVTDTGPGIETANLSRIFEPYWTTKISGSGLGLTLVFKIVQEHNGEITVDTKPGKGTCFLISLPLPPEDMRRLPYSSWQGAGLFE